MATRVTVTCPDCGLEETYDRLRDARERIDAHETGTDHEPTWEIERLSPGVERAGADAGVCGIDGCANPDSPLLDRRE